MTCGLAFVPASHSVFLVYERAVKAKHLQYVSGLTPIIYWTANLIIDMVGTVQHQSLYLAYFYLYVLETYVGITAEGS